MSPASDIHLRVVLDASSTLRAIDRANMSLLPARLVADLGGMVARWRMARGLSDEPASAGDLAMMILSLEGIGEAIVDAYTRGMGVLVPVTQPADEKLGIEPRHTFSAITFTEAKDAAQEQAPRQD